MKAGQWIQAERSAQAIDPHLDILRQQAVTRSGLVQRTGEQGIKHQARQVGRRIALDREWIELVEGGYAQVADQAQFATARCRRVHVIEMGEGCRVLEIAPQGITMRSPDRRGGAEHEQKQQTAHATILQDFSRR